MSSMRLVCGLLQLRLDGKDGLGVSVTKLKLNVKDEGWIGCKYDSFELVYRTLGYDG